MAAARQDAPASSARVIFLNIDVLCTVSSRSRRRRRPIGAVARDQYKSKADRFGKRKRRFDSPRRQSASFCPVAFIFDERSAAMVNRWFAFLPLTTAARSARVSGVNSTLNRICLKDED
jgi:hypothetical protein